jgi:hypothetical protein
MDLEAAKKIVKERIQSLETELFETRHGKKFETPIPQLQWLIHTGIRYLCALELAEQGIPVKFTILPPDVVTQPYEALN